LLENRAEPLQLRKNQIREDIMTFSQRVEKGKPYITGFIAGLVAAPIVAFSAGWVSTSGARAEAVENARIDTLAAVCSHEAQKSWALKSMDPAALKGWDNRVAREELVANTMSGIQVPEPIVTKVTASCNRTLG
jgi:hypothetical protein